MINVQNPNLVDKVCLHSYIYDRIEDPLKTLNSFFDYQDLQAHLKKLEQWHEVVVSNGYFEINTQSNPLYDHKMICNLVNAIYLLRETGNDQVNLIKNLSEKEQEKYLNHECLNFDFYVKHLNTSEMIDPFLGLEKVFEYFTLQSYHEQLYEWLNIGLSPNVVIDDSILAETFYKNLCILIECSWLIYQRNLNTNIEYKTSSLIQKEVVEFESDEEIPSHVLAEFKKFLTVVPADRLNRGLRKMLIDYLFYNLNGLPTDFEELLSDFYWLTDLLDEIQGKTLDPKFV